MAKAKNIYVCTGCGYESGKWLGKCPSCESWNAFVEEVSAPKTKSLIQFEPTVATLLREVDITNSKRKSTGSEEFDRVLGGGLVEGSAVLIGGDPGIGKSTLLLQTCGAISKTATVLYVSGEESVTQIKMRAQRLDLQYDNMFLLCETDLDQIESQIKKVEPRVIIIDSIQTMMRQGLANSQGSVTQVREATMSLTSMAKRIGASIFIVGHVTKVGSIAGPMVLEHIVDTVLFFEGDRYDNIRILRTVKNRFGSTNEIAVFEMAEEGLRQVSNPSELFLSSRQQELPGCAVMCTMEGSRPLVAEVQALVCKTAFGTPRRMATGVDYNRMIFLAAVFEKKLGAKLFDQDVFVNVVGGLKIDERAVDLAVLAAVASSLHEKPLSKNAVAIGEVGLTGEIRSVNNIAKRVGECAKLGFTKIILPETNLKSINIKGVELFGVNSVKQALDALINQ